MVPALPKTSIKNYSDESLGELMKLYNRFLNALCRSEVLKTSKMLVTFLKLDSLSQWSIEKKKYEKVKFSRLISEVISETGKINVEEKKQNKNFCDKIKDFVGSYANLTSEIVDLSKQVYSTSQQLAQQVLKLAGCYESLSKMHKKVKINS